MEVVPLRDLVPEKFIWPKESFFLSQWLGRYFCMMNLLVIDLMHENNLDLESPGCWQFSC